MQRIIKRLTYYLFALLVVGQTACLDTIEIDVPTIFENGLVIQGGLIRHSDKARVIVQFRSVSDEKSQSNVIRVQNAYVHNDLGQSKELILDVDGFYKTMFEDSINFNYSFGRSFYVKVTTYNGDQFISEPEILSNSPAIESLSWKKVKKSIVNNLNQVELADFVEIYLTTPKPESLNYLKFDVINAYQYTDQLEGFPPGKLCYVTQRADTRNVLLYDHTSLAEPVIKDIPVYDHRIDYLFSEGYYGTIVLQSIGKKAYDYYTQINELNNREGSIYDAPAGRVISNIKNMTHPDQDAYGFFYAVSQDTARISIQPEEVGNPSRQCPVPPSETSPCPVRFCCDCLTINGAKLEKPWYWQ
ncbi:MAG: DUF4249 family protein [Saprospiraceae bacterium]|nr:DUF4249 family protein [Saprospiraceae bacterium]